MSSITTKNPCNGQALQTYTTIDRPAAAIAAEQAQQCFAIWKQTNFEERAVLLRNIATSLRAKKEALANLATREMGKPINQSMAEVEKCAMSLEYYATHGGKMLQDELVITDAQKSFVSFQPLGVVLAVMPWNFPYWQVFRAMGPILMAGNTMLLKHASNVSGCALAIEDILKEAGAPRNLFQTLLLPASEVSELIAHPSIAAVTFTGSTTAGKQVASVAASHIKKQVLELGGSDAYILLKDADLDLAVKTCVNGRLVNSGQSCVAAKRFIVVKEMKSAFEQGMLAAFEATCFGDPMDEKNKIGPMARKDLRDELHQQVLESIAKGAVLLCGGYIPDGEGAFYPPTILTNVKKGMPAYDDELFGPVAAIIEAHDEADAIHKANETIYGLGSGIFSQDIQRAEEIASKELQSGSCFVNAFVHSDPRLPFGGIKQSGYGRELSGYGIREFVNIKTVYVG
jgi:succinate-semialdehyde dehydrogenase/glutarate-semialdehyde dehydrogenase